VSKRARTDLQLAVAFLCTRVSCSTEKDWDKLVRLLQYLNGTLGLALILGADSLNANASWVYASYAVHDNMKSHTGGAFSLGQGALMCKSTKQKLNTKSSTEAEVVGSRNYLPNVIWAKMLLAEQGYELPDNVFYQDNQSAIRLEKNGRASCGQKSRHIDIRYFFMKDRFESEKNFCRVLSHGRNACRFFYETSSRQFVPKIPRRPFRSLPCEYTPQITAASLRGAC